MLHEFLRANRADLIRRCRAKVADRCAPKAPPAEIEHGIPKFLDQIIQALRVQQAAEALKSRIDCAGPVRRAANDAGSADTSEIGATAMQHGLELCGHGFTVDQVVHHYGDLCQAVTDLAAETHTTIEASEFRTFNHCLDDAIAGAVSEFAYQRESALTQRNLEVSDERARALLQELQAQVETATLALEAVKGGKVGLHGATGGILGLSLVSMRTLIARSLAAAEGSAGLRARH